MPDLSHKAVHQFWHDYQDSSIYRVITFMESVENWTFDDEPLVEAALSKLGELLEDIGNVDLQQEANIVEIVARIKTGRGLRLLMCLDMAYPGAAAKVLMHAENSTKAETDLPGIFLRRNLVFERLRLLSRIFSKDRFELIQKTLEEASYD